MKPYEEIIKSGRLFNVDRTGILNSGFIKLTDAGTCTLMWCDNEAGWEHVSISPKKKYKMPTWNDMCQLKDIFFNSDEEVLQLHPKRSEYVNIMENCLHLWKPGGIDIMNTLDEVVRRKGCAKDGK